MNQPDRSPTALSRTRIRKAGSKLRAWARGGLTDSEAQEWFDVVNEYRQQFSYPLLKVNNGLRHKVRALGLQGRVTQRLKRFDTIVDKLTERETSMDLSRMHDIGGCRVVLNGPLADLYRLKDDIESSWEVRESRDYIEEPRESGYRAIHVVLLRDCLPIEVQIRNETMHSWAQAVEGFGSMMGINYKKDGGTTTFDAMMLARSRVEARLDAGEEPTPQERHAEAELVVKFLDEYYPEN